MLRSQPKPNLKNLKSDSLKVVAPKAKSKSISWEFPSKSYRKTPERVFESARAPRDRLKKLDDFELILLFNLSVSFIISIGIGIFTTKWLVLFRTISIRRVGCINHFISWQQCVVWGLEIARVVWCFPCGGFWSRRFFVGNKPWMFKCSTENKSQIGLQQNSCPHEVNYEWVS